MTPRSGSQKNVFFGAIILLAWLGTATERTDIVAHLTGFIAGFAIGALVGRSPRRPGTNSGRQWLSAAATLLVLVVAWQFALRAAGFDPGPL